MSIIVKELVRENRRNKQILRICEFNIYSMLIYTSTYKNAMVNSSSFYKSEKVLYDKEALKSDLEDRDKSRKDYYPSQIDSTILLQWLEDDNFISKQSNSFSFVVIKRIIDILIAAVVIVFVLSWVLPIIALFILLDSPGPIFFIQKRTGYKGRSFACLKFRTMRKTNQTGFQQTKFKDSRVTRVGKFLRKTSLDELPQFINVLMGNMSVVGPRPHATQHDALHWSSPSYRNRYCIKPGITGLAQIRGARGETDEAHKMEHRVRYDLLYVRKQDISLDTAIFFLTIKIMIRGDKNAW